MPLGRMRRFTAEIRGMGKDGPDAWRVTTTLSLRQRDELERLANENGVKVAWLIRRAVERMLDEAQGEPVLPLEFKRR